MQTEKDLNWLKDVPVNMIVELGKSNKSVEEILLWKIGSIIKLEDSIVNVLRIYINNHFLGTGFVLRNDDGDMSLKIDKTIDGGLNEDFLKNPDM